MYTLIAKIAEAVTRGVIKAVWAELRKPRTATDEEVSDEDQDRERHIRGVLDRYLVGVSPDGDGDPERNNPPSIESANDGPPLA